MLRILAVSLFIPFLVGALKSEDEVPWMRLFRGVALKDPDPKPCCLPETWEGYVESDVAESKKGGTFRRSKTQIFVDGAKKRVAGKVYCPFTGKEVQGFIGLFNESSGVGFKLYVFPKPDSHKCFHYCSPKAVYKKTCLPEDARFKGSWNLGLASSSYHINSFDFDIKNKYLKMIGNAVVTKDCIPVIYKVAGEIRRREEDDADKKLYFREKDSQTFGKKFVVNAYYHELYPHIHDAGVFDLPEACKNKPVLSDNDADDDFQKVIEDIKSFMNYVAM